MLTFVATFTGGAVIGALGILADKIWTDRKEEKEYQLTKKIQWEAEVAVDKALCKHKADYHLRKE